MEPVLDAAHDDVRLWGLVSDAVTVVDRDGRITAASPSFTRVFAVEHDDPVGMPITTFVHPDDRVTVEAYLAHPEAVVRHPHGRPTVAQLRIGCEGSGWSDARVEVRPADADAGEWLAFTLRRESDVDVRADEYDRRALEQLRLIDEMKHRLMEAASHELRTPLTVVIGFAQTLQRRGVALDPDRLVQIAARIESAGTRLQRIIGDLLDLDRAARGTLISDHGLHDLGQLTRAVIETVPLGRRKLVVDIDDIEMPVDPSRYERIVESLLVNAHRHTPEGTTVEVRLHPHEGGALLEVLDDGPGLPPELEEDVFSPFVQGALIDDSSPGLGLGLALVRRFAEIHGGRCWTTRPDAGGCGFHVYLPASRKVPTSGAALSTVIEVARRYEQHATNTVRQPVEVRPDAMAFVGPMLRTLRDQLGMEVAYLSVFSGDEQLVLATDGDGDPIGITPGLRIPIQETYCARMVRGEVPHVIPDTSQVPVLAELPATRGGLASYIGVPVRLSDGAVVGSLCCAASRPHDDLAAHHADVMRAIARVLGDQLSEPDVVRPDHAATHRRVSELLGRPDEITILYQPIVDLADGRVVGVEALSRFPDGRLRPPDVWFADAQLVGLGRELEQAALMRALPGLAHLPDDVYLSVNMTPATIVAGGLRPLLGRVPLERIVVEVTEHAAIADYEQLLGALDPFLAAGARLAVDDVGAGFASLRHVLLTHPAVVKIDRALISQITTDPIQRSVAQALADVSKQLGAKVVAEGIEDAETVGALVEAGITHGQGWLFSRARPLPLDRLRYTT